MKSLNYNPLAKTVIKTGLLAGTLDIVAAFLQTYLTSGRHPEIVLRYVASGVWGDDAFTGSELMMVYGLVFHYLIATCWTAVYFLFYPVVKIQPSKYVAGVCFGIIVWTIMNFVTLPLSNVPQPDWNWKAALQGCLIIIAAIGMPIAFSAARYYKGRTQKAS